MAEYIGRRIVPTHGGVWNETKEYEELVIVLDEESGDSYISRIPVPSGTALDDEEYWMLFSIYSEQIQEALDAIEETSEEMVAYVDKTAASLTEYVQETAEDLTEKVEAAEDLTESNTDTLNDRMETIEARLDANVTASTDSDADYAAEVVDARVDDTGETHDSLGDNVRSIGKIRTLANILDNWTWSVGYVNDSGTLSSSSTWRAAQLIPVNGTSVIVNGSFGYMSGKDTYNNIVCYDRNREYLGGCFRAENGVTYDYYEVELLDDTEYISVTTSSSLVGSSALYLPADLRALQLIDDHGDWQWMNGQVDITWSGTDLSVAFTGACYLCRRRAGSDYVQTKVNSTNDLTTEWERSSWWAIYFQGESGTTDATVSDEDEDADPVIHVESTTSSWADLFTPDRFVIAVFYASHLVYAVPSNNGTYINSVDYGNPAYRAYKALNLAQKRSAKMYLASGAMEINATDNTIQITQRSLAVVDNATYLWLDANDEANEINEASEGMEGYMRILGYDNSTQTFNFYETSEFRDLGSNGYYIGAWYQNKLYYPHMNPSYKITLDGTEYSAGELFATETSNTFVEKRYQDAIDDALGGVAAGTRTVYIARGSITLDIDTSTYEGTIQVTSQLLGVTEDQQFIWISANDEAYDLNSPTSGSETHMRIFGYDASSKTVNLFRTAEFQALGADGYYIASWWNSKLYNPHMSPDVRITYNGTEYSAGELFYTDSVSYVAQPYKDYVEDYISDYVAGDTDEDDLGDIVSPSHWDCMEGRQFSMFFDCLSRHEGRINLYRLVNSMSLTRNEYCMNFTPDADDDDFTITIRRLNENTMETAETKTVTMKVHHPLTTSLTKNVCICGDSLVDNKYLTQEVWDMLDEDGDCVINHIGTRGGTGYEHEGRGSWTWAKYLQGEDYSNKSNAFWDADNERLDFQKYCEDNGYEGIDYFLIALGTNDVSQGSTLYNCEDDVQKFIDYAKEFIDALLDEETGFPDCKIGIGLCGPGADYSYLANSSMQIFRRSINTLNLALIKNFDDGAYHENVTCFAHGLRTDRMHAFPYSNSATTDRFEETSRTLTNSIHPSSRGYQAWADGYYCQIRAWLEEDAEEVAQG